MSLQKRIEEIELTIRCFESVLYWSSQTATQEFLNWQQEGLEKAKAELQRLQSL